MKRTVVVALLFCLVSLAGCEIRDDEDTGDLAVTPESVVVSGKNNVAFTVTGGVGPYYWNVNDSTLGTVIGAQSTAIYTSSGALGQNYVIVTDGNHNSVSATITQQ